MKYGRLIPVMLCFFAMGFVDLVGIASNYVKADLGLTDSQANIFPSLVFFWFLIFSVPTGMLMNRIGRKNTVLLSLFVTALSLLLPFFGDGYGLMLCSFSLLGIGNALMQTSLNPLLSNIISGDRLASSLTFGQFVKAIASFLAPYIAMWGATQAMPTFGLGWRVLFPVYMVVAVIAILWLSSTPIEEEKPDQASGFADCLRLLGQPFILLCFLGIVCHVGIDVGTNTTAPKLLMERVGLTLEEAGFATSLYFIFRTAGCLLGTFILQHLSARRFLGISVTCMLVAMAGLLVSDALTDPSYYGQIITQTYPLIGNYGMNKDDMESDRIWAKGYIVREACTTPSNWRCEETLDSFLKKNNTIGIEGIDTRHLTRIIRESGVMNGAILTTFDPADPANKAETEALLAQIRAYAVTDAVKNVTCEKPEVFNPQGETHIVLMHYGCKRNIVRCLVKRGCKVTVMPAFATAEEIKALAPDGIMLSNGPGDPAEPVEVIENLKHIFELNIPTFGICLGHQLSALAAGAKTMKLKYGHRGANQPVTDFESGRTFITSQNHGYAVVGDELPAEMGEVAQVNANDGTCEGIKYKKWNCFTVQFHPEANGGPKDTEFLFDRFLNNVKAAKKEAR